MGPIRTKSYICKEGFFRVVEAQQANEKKTTTKDFATNQWIIKLPIT